MAAPPPGVPIGQLVRAEGRVQVVTYSAPGGGEWEVRLEIEALGAGEVVGVGSIATALPARGHRRSWDVVVAGLLGADGTATLRLEPLDGERHVSVTMLVRVTSDPDTEDPLVDEVLAVEA